MRIKNMVFAVLFGAAVLTVVQGQLSQAGPLASCEKSCSISPGECHLQKAGYLLHGYEKSVADCVRPEFPFFEALSPVARTVLGIKEIDAAVANPVGLEKYMNDLRLEQAGARIALARLYLKEEKTEAAKSSFLEAGSLYLSFFQAARGAANFVELGPAIAGGLLRSGMPVEALEVLKVLPESSARAYLTAEVFFSIGNRQAAAENYEKWISSDCQFDPVMLLNDEYGRKWTLLIQGRPSMLSRCEQVPQELRSRLETLNEVFRHPDNLPARSYPGILFPARAHY